MNRFLNVAIMSPNVWYQVCESLRFKRIETDFFTFEEAQNPGKRYIMLISRLLISMTTSGTFGVIAISSNKGFPNA